MNTDIYRLPVHEEGLRCTSCFTVYTINCFMPIDTIRGEHARLLIDDLV